MKKVESLKYFIRNKFAWPGGYPLMAIMYDGDPLCDKCAKSNFRQIVQATKQGDCSGWAIADVVINYEDNCVFCAHCNSKIECAYDCEVQ